MKRSFPFPKLSDQVFDELREFDLYPLEFGEQSKTLLKMLIVRSNGNELRVQPGCPRSQQSVPSQLSGPVGPDGESQLRAIANAIEKDFPEGMATPTERWTIQFPEFEGGDISRHPEERASPMSLEVPLQFPVGASKQPMEDTVNQTPALAQDHLSASQTHACL